MTEANSRSRRIWVNSVSTSPDSSTDVGSSRMITGANLVRCSMRSTLAISTICRSAKLSVSVRASGSIVDPILSSCSCASLRMVSQRYRPRRTPGPSLPRTMFSAAVRLGTSDCSWNTMPTPWLAASTTLRILTFSPRT